MMRNSLEKHDLARNQSSDQAVAGLKRNDMIITAITNANTMPLFRLDRLNMRAHYSGSVSSLPGAIQLAMLPPCENPGKNDGNFATTRFSGQCGLAATASGTR
jgi:hypothetical protein